MATLAFRSEGQGTPILCLHGWTMAGFVEAADYEPMFTQHPSQYKRIYPDLPGHGSTPADGVRDLDEMFERLARFIDKELPAPQKFLLAGSSCGAYFARAVVYRFRERVIGLLLRVPLVEPNGVDRDVDTFQPVIVNEKLRETFPPSALKGMPVQTPEYITVFQMRIEEQVVPATAAADDEALDPIRRDSMRYRLTAPMHRSAESFKKPTLIVTGRQDSVTGYRDAWNLLPAYPRASFALMDRAGHGLPVDEMPFYRAMVEDWLRRVAETEDSAAVPV